MIEIDINKINIDKIIEKHNEYIENIVCSRVNDVKTGIKPKYKRFIDDIFGTSNDEINQRLKYYCSSPNLKEIIDNFEEVYKKNYKKSFFSDVKKSKRNQSYTVKTVTNLIANILNYSSFNKHNGWNRHAFINSLDIKVCPYCNRNYITSYYESKNDKKTTADADHYYPKSLYPILQLNIYNMIPSCNVCNSKMKNDKDKLHIYPYKTENNRVQFSVNLNNLSDLYNFNDEDIKINVTSYGEKAKNSIEVFKLDKVYQIHTDVVFELKNKFKDSIAFEGREDYYNKLLGEDIFKEIDWSTNWFDFIGKDPLKEPLAKLKQDIYYQMTAIR